MDYSMPSSWMEGVSFRKSCPLGGLFLGYSLFIDEGLEGFPSIDASDTVGQNAHLFGSNNLQHILSAGLDAVVSSDSADIDAISIA